MQQYGAIDKAEALRLDQEAMLPDRAPYQLSPSEIVDTFPQGKATVKRLMAECEVTLQEYEDTQNTVREFLSGKVPMWDIGITTEMIMAGRYGHTKKVTQEKLSRLKRLWRLYVPPPPSTGNVDERHIARAKEFPIKELVKIGKGNNAKCVWHVPDKHPSMHIYPDNHAHCFSCSKGSDVIGVYQALTGCDFVTAVKYLAKV